MPSCFPGSVPHSVSGSVPGSVAGPVSGCLPSPVPGAVPGPVPSRFPAPLPALPAAGRSARLRGGAVQAGSSGQRGAGDAPGGVCGATGGAPRAAAAAA